jgi:hypothetical protein
MAHGGSRAGAGRRRGEARVPLTVRVLPGTRAAVEAEAFRTTQTLGAVIDAAIGSERKIKESSKKEKKAQRKK